MSGYKIRLMLYTHIETWREITIPKDITFRELHILIQKLFGFTDSHNYEFNLPAEMDDGENVDLNNIIETIDMDDAENTIISKYFDKYVVMQYIYDYGANWEIIVYKMEDINYDKKTALLDDYGGKYNPSDDVGDISVFEEIMECLDDEDELIDILDDYGLTLNDLKKWEFENRYEKGSKILIK